MTHMIFSRLKDMLCPSCRSSLQWKALAAMYECSSEKCSFDMGEEAFNRTVSGLYTPRQRARIRSEEENLSILNNFGHKVRSEDYSDV